MPAKGRSVYVIGVGTTAYTKPRNEREYTVLGQQATVKALLDAGITYDAIESAYCGYMYGDSTCGQRTLYGIGMTKIPIHNVHNNCASGSSALQLAFNAVAYGMNECALAVGFEKMEPGSLSGKYHDRVSPLSSTFEKTEKEIGITTGPFNAQLFGNGADAYCKKFGATWEHVGKISSKNHNNSVRNPYSQFRNPMSLKEVMADKMIAPVGMTRAMCCPTSDGGSAVIVASEDYVHKHGLENQAIEIAALALTTDSPKLHADFIELVGSDAVRECADQVFKTAGISRDSVKVCELHDCFAANELLLYDALGLCEPGKAHEFIDRGDNDYGGKVVVNPSGGLESKGHPLGATGLGMTFYLVNQLRGWAGPMQVPGIGPNGSVKEPYALLQNLGLGGACVCALFKRPSFYKEGGADGRTRLGYNHGEEFREATPADFKKVVSKAYSAIAANPH